MKEAEGYIHIKGAREHNLKNIELKIPRDKFVVITGVSGSGKSSLAFDTLYAEGARQYLESLSTKMRANLEQIPRPDLDFIHGLSPVISIEQRSAANNNPRATVASVTEIADYARILWTIAGTQFCPDDGGLITRRSLDDCLNEIMQFPTGTKLILGAPHSSVKSKELKLHLEKLQRRGFQRVRINGELLDLDDFEETQFAKEKKELQIDLIVDRIIWSPEQKTRLTDSLELAFREGKNQAFILANQKELPLRLELSCNVCGKVYEPLSPKNFSPTHPDGACPCCGGLGTLPQFQEELLVPDKNKNVRDAIKPWKYGSKKMITQRNAWIKQIGEQLNFTPKTPWRELPEETQKILLHGNEKILIKTGRGKNSLAPFPGILADLQKTATTSSSLLLRSRLLSFQTTQTCPKCLGTRLNPRAQAVKLHGINLGEFLAKTIPDALNFVKSLKNNPLINPIEDARAGLEKRLQFLETTGLSYLSLCREYNTLSGGEIQRVRLAAQLGLGLVGVTYILDEPSIGLHPIDQARLIEQLKALRDRGNSVLVVEHDAQTMLAADFLIEIGPDAGQNGGQLIFAGTPKSCLKNANSKTAQFLKKVLNEPKEKLQSPPLLSPKEQSPIGKTIQIYGASENNLQNINVEIPIGALTCVCGVSGSGKSTLINNILGNTAARKINRAKVIPGKHKAIEGLENFNKFVQIDQSPIGQSPRSNPATFTGIFDALRKLFAEIPLAKIRGYDAGRFSFNKQGGRCEKCQGNGQIALDMQFLGETWIECPTCHGKRYNRETLEILFKGKNIAEILEMTISEAETFFRAQNKIHETLQILCEIGLGYLKLGQAAQTLSGGEAQRLKLSKFLKYTNPTQISPKNNSAKTLFLLDEPTTGLHHDDILKLMDVLKKLKNEGNTIILIEHNTQVIKTADFLIELGPEGGKNGGKLIFTGTPTQLKAHGKTPTAQFAFPPCELP